MKNFIVINLVLCAIFLSQCKYENIETLEGDCVNIGAYGSNAIFDTLFQTFPCFNPVNPDEFLFVESRNPPPQKIYKYNLVTLNKTLIFEGKSLYPPKWGGNGWILLNLQDENIWKIREDGSQLTQLTFTGGLFNPEWLGLTDSFVVTKSDSGPFTILYDINGTPKDTFYVPFTTTDNYNLIVGAAEGYKIFNLYKDSTYIVPYGVSIEGAELVSLKNNHVLRADFTGIYYRELDKPKDIKIHSACNSRYYSSGTYSLGRNQVIWQRGTKEILNVGESPYVKSRLVIMNIDGTEERELVIP
ncbi:MAG: hypothetical protein K1X92_14085 [Bacteroidia bacterium]|nr:hypothetical protein [Bacteroidia bacterium]